MGFEITVYRAVRMKAEACHSNGSSWVDVTVIEPQSRGPVTESTLTIHFSGDDAQRKANAYAASISVVDAQFHPHEIIRERADA